MDFYSKFTNLCNIKGVSPSSACVGMGLSGSAMQRWRDNSTPTRLTLFKMAEYFGYDIQQFIDYARGMREELPEKARSITGIAGLDSASRVESLLNNPLLKAYYGFVNECTEEEKELIARFIHALAEIERE